MLKKYFSISLLIFSTFFLLYVIYKSEFVWWGKKQDYFLIYYIFSIFLLILSIVTFIISDNLKEYVFIITFSIFVSAYFSEIYLSIGDNAIIKKIKIKKEKLDIYKKKTGKKFDTRSRLKIFQDLRKKNDNVVVTVHPSAYLKKKNLEIFPLSSASNSTTILCNEMGYYNIYKSDRYGFNNPDSEWDQKETEYLLIGDSYTHGSCVNRPNDIASVLRQLSKKSVLNLGYEGTGPLIQFATLKEYIKPNIKNIIWMYSEINDFDNLKAELNNKILLNYLEKKYFSQNLKNKQNLINQLSRDIIDEFIKKKKEFSLFKFIKLTNLRMLLHSKFSIIDSNNDKFGINTLFLRSTSNYDNFPIDELRKIFQKVIILTEKNNSKLYMVYFPAYFRYDRNFIKNNQELLKALDFVYNNIKLLAEDLKIPFIDLNKEIVSKENNPNELLPFNMFVLPSLHMNEVGYRKYSEFIYSSISK